MTTLRNRDMLCFSHDWTGDPLSKTHVMRLLSKDNRILWVNSIGYRAPTATAADASRAWKKLKAAAEPVREVEPNIFVFSPLVVPAYGIAAVRALNQRLLAWQVRRAMKTLGFRDPLNWIFNPAAALIAGRLGEKEVIYYCVDEYTAFTGVAAKQLGELEDQLLRRADVVIVSAERLLHAKSGKNPKTVMVRHGVDFEHFRRALDPATQVPDEIANLPRPILGFVGLIADWVDFELFAKVARRYPQGSVVLVGKSTCDVGAIAKLPNVHLLGRKPYAEIPAYCKGFDVSLNPFLINDLTLNANPLKVREYLAAGLPVVSTAMPEVAVLPDCRIGHDHDGFLREIDDALASPGPQVAISERIRPESWAARVEEIRGHFARLLA